MFIKQLSIFLENKGGSLGEVLKILSGQKINIFSASDVVGVCVPNETGGFSKVVQLILDAGLNISYIYGLSVQNDGANIVMKTDDLDKTVSILKAAGVKLLEQADL
ncbi:MAG: hypothetical protein IJR40_03760 [Treponema sp.]|nr:hypothetical protein [Treponema sp.]